MFDNPSAGRFDAPPGAERFDPPRPERRGRWIAGALGLAFVAAKEYTRWSHPRGVWALAGVLLLTALAVLQFVARRKIQPDEHNPFSEQTHVTR